MVGNWRQRKESGVDTKEGVIKVSVLKAVLFLWRGLKPPAIVVLFFFHFSESSWKLADFACSVVVQQCG